MRKLFPAAAATCTALLLAACGGGGSSNATLPNSVTTATGSNNAASGNPTLAACDYVIYVPNSGNNTVTAYDADGHQIKLPNGAFPNLEQPEGIAYDPLNNRLYVVNEGGGYGQSSPAIAAYDENGTAISLSDEGYSGGLDDVAFLATTSHLAATSLRDGAIETFDQSGNVVGGFSNGPGYYPNAITFDPSNGYTYVSSATGSVTNPFAILVFDKSGNQLPNSGFQNIDNAPLVNNQQEYNAPNGIAYDSATHHLYIATQRSGTNGAIYEYDEAGNQISTTGSFPNINQPVGIVFDPQNRHLYVTNGNNTITVYDEHGNQVTTSGSFPNLNGPMYLVLAPHQ